VKVLVINSGSSSVKAKLFDMDDREQIASVRVERIGEEEGLLTWRRHASDQGAREVGTIQGHREAFGWVVRLLSEAGIAVPFGRFEISVVAHRVVHGGAQLKEPVLIDEGVIEVIREATPLAPLHNPSNITGIEIAAEKFPGIPQVAVFDTAFHRTMKKEAFLYPLPLEFYEKRGIRRYGFHGISHEYVSRKGAEAMRCAPEQLNLITLHLGNGASMAAIQRGRCVDSTMGLTPLAGLMMGTRSGDIDPALPSLLFRELGMSLTEIDGLLNYESGLKGICGSNDMREVLRMKNQGGVDADLAVRMYVYRIRKGIGALFAVMGSLDALIFTGGVGENEPEIRELCCSGLSGLGIQLDRKANRRPDEGAREIGTVDSPVRTWVIPTDEEWAIATVACGLLETAGSARS
jgi:acetate kinase